MLRVKDFKMAVRCKQKTRQEGEDKLDAEIYLLNYYTQKQRCSRDQCGITLHNGIPF